MRAQRERPLPDVDAEEELELGRYWNALITRWWLPLAGLVAGIAIGYLLSLGGHQVYQAKATIYLGQPLNPTGTGQIQSLATNPSTVKQVVLSPYWQHVAEQRAGLANGSLRAHVSTQAVAGVAAALGRAVQEQRQVITDQTQNEQLLTLAQTVEQSQVITPARATKTTARSRRNSVLVGALIGLVLGILAALLWEPAARVVRRTAV